jgi:hypothetical protein
LHFASSKCLSPIANSFSAFRSNLFVDFILLFGCVALAYHDPMTCYSTTSRAPATPDREVRTALLMNSTLSFIMIPIVWSRGFSCIFQGWAMSHWFSIAATVFPVWCNPPDNNDGDGRGNSDGD